MKSGGGWQDKAGRNLVHPEVEAEQAYLDRAHARLDAMREAARALSAEVVGEGAGGTFANRVERDIRVELSGRRLAQLNIGDAAVAFGRLDFTDGLRAYIGRLGISDENGDQLVVDWRAPVAEPFYRATPAEPLGVSRRRHFMFRGRRITGIDDELLDREAPADGLVLMGEGALMASLEQVRTGRMHEIVSTIQSEQDAVIRSELAGVLVVQGGPGTGKTAVALHRAAYLLFTYRQRLSRDGVLLVGPNNVFLRYIEQVLPSLGEHTVALATPGELYAGRAKVRASEPAPLAELKGEGRMAQLLGRAVTTRERPLRHPLEVSYGRHVLVLSTEETRRIVKAARSRRGTHNSRRGYVERQLARALARAWRQQEETSVRLGHRRAISKEESERVSGAMAGELRHNPAWRAALERMWPLLSPEELLHDLYGAPALLLAAGKGLFSGPELAMLARPRSRSLEEIPWTESDMSLLDEAAALLGPVRRPRARRGRGEGDDGEAWMLERALVDYLPDCPACGAQLDLGGGDRPWQCERCSRRWRDDQVSGGMDSSSLARFAGQLGPLTGRGDGPVMAKGARVYGHVLVDEAQGVSPMQWRALSRRCPAGSFTVVGDLGQASGARAPSSWEEALSEVRTRSGLRTAVLSVNYRTPAEVMALAAAVLAEAAPELAPPSSARQSGQPPRAVHVSAGSLLDEAVVAALGETTAVSPGKVAVIAPLDRLDELSARLEAPAAGAHEELSATEARHLLEAPLAVLGLDAARGLEFDSVVLVEPAAIVAEHSQGLRALYVALTRTTRRLTILHSGKLPAGLEALLGP